jgi:hypothetical protein
MSLVERVRELGYAPGDCGAPPCAIIVALDRIDPIRVAFWFFYKIIS